MDHFVIQYTFNLGDDKQAKSVFVLLIDAQTLEIIHPQKQELPAWTELGYKQCPHCPLDPQKTHNCPAAVCLNSVIEKFNDVVSYDKVELEVITDDRKITQQTSAQKSISSLLGLMLATSGCPHTSFFKPMAHFHLPLATPQETVFRASGMYLLSQYFLEETNPEAKLELEGLKEIYNNLHILNHALAKRMSEACITDSTKNAIAILDMLANYLPIVINDHLDGIKHLFDSYITE